jgi:hypothetical protein
MILHRRKLISLSASLLLAAITLTACGGGVSDPDGGPRPPPSRPGVYCLKPGGEREVHRERLSCGLGSLPRGQAKCDFFINAVTSNGNVFQILNVAPAFPPDVDEGDDDMVDILMESGSQTGTVTVQKTHRNCHAQPRCNPQAIASVTVSPLCN